MCCSLHHSTVTTYHIDPSPSTSILTPIDAFQSNNQSDHKHCEDSSDKDTGDWPTDPLEPTDLETPNAGEELTVCEAGEDGCMKSEG